MTQPTDQLDSLVAAAEQRGRVNVIHALVKAMRRDPLLDVVGLLDALIEQEGNLIVGAEHDRPRPQLV